MAEPAAKMIMGLDVDLVADGLGGADRSEGAQFGQLGEGRVDRAPAQLGDFAKGAGVDLLGGEVLGLTAGEGAEYRPALRRDAQRETSQQVRVVGAHRPRLTTEGRR